MVNHNTNPLSLQVANHDYTDFRRLPAYSSVSLTQNMGIAPSSGELVLRGDHPLAARLMEADGDDVVPVVAMLNNWPWTGVVDDWVIEGTPEHPVLTCTLVDDKDQLANLRAFNSPNSGLAVQPKHDEKKGAVLTVATDYIAQNMARAQIPGYIMMPPRDDRSPHVSVVTKMGSITDILSDVLNQHDIVCDIRMWWPGQPFPTGKFADITEGTPDQRRHKIREASLDQTFTTNNTPLSQPKNPGLLIHLHEARDRSYIRWSSDQAGVKHFRMGGRSAGAARQIAGGKSDEWVNEIIDTGIDLAITGILAAIGSAGGPIGAIAGGVVGTIIGNLVGSVVKSETNDTVFAYQDRTDVERQARLGPFHRRENFTSSSAGAFTFDTGQIVEKALHDSKGGRSIEISVAAGIANVLGVDEYDPQTRKIRHGYMPGDRNRFRDHISGKEVVDIISAVTVTDSVDQRVRITPTIGKTKNIVDPYSEMVGKIGSLFSITESINMSG